MSEMIERVAKAILNSIADNSNNEDLKNSILNDIRLLKICKNHAKAVIERAMRDPTKEMINVGIQARWKSPIRDENNVQEIWQAMIEAALKE